MNYDTVAGGLGVVSGVVVAIGGFLVPSTAFPTPCQAGMILSCAGLSWYIAAAGAFGIALAVSSIAGLLGFRTVFYIEFGTGAVCLFILVSLLGVASIPFAILSAALCLVSCGTSIVAARRKKGLSEQANPMNLPVFG